MDEPKVMDEDWELLRSLFPQGWRELAGATGALKGLRKNKDPEDFLRTLLLHLACGYSLRETAVRARETKLAELSDVALLKRLRKSKGWLHALCRRLLEEQVSTSGAQVGGDLRLVDATLIAEPGRTGSQWRIHYSLRWPELACDHFELTSTRGAGCGESLKRFTVQAGEHLLADRGYSNYTSLRHVANGGAVVTVRLNPNALRLLDDEGQTFALARALRSVRRAGQIGCWPVAVTGAGGQASVTGRLCVLRKSRAAIAKACQKARRKARCNARTLRADTLLYAEYVIVFTTTPASLTPAQVLEIYRLRWQIELVFKRFKQLAHLGHLPKEDPESSQAWLYGKLFVALLTEKIVRYAESFSPWGYDLAPQTASEPLA